MNDRFKVKLAGEKARWSSCEDAAIVKGMLARGDKQSDVAAYFGANSGRIAETNIGRRYATVMPAPLPLPPSGPHISANIQIVGVAEEFRREQHKTNETLAQTNEKLDHLQRLLLALGRNVGLIENPQTPRIGRRKPMEA
jgi:hypothetical protein